MNNNEIKNVRHAIHFHQIYNNNTNKHIREAECLLHQIPHILVPINDEDLIAGRMQHGFLGFSPQYGGVYTYYFNEEMAKSNFESCKNYLEPEEILAMEEITTFWSEEATTVKHKKRFKEIYGVDMPSAFQEPGIANSDSRIAGTNVDLDKLVRLGIPGLRKEIQEFSEKAEDKEFYTALEMALDGVVLALELYEKQARELAKESNGKRLEELLELSEILKNIQTKVPSTFKEGLQLVWIYAVVSDLMNYGRMDVYLGDLYVADIENGNIDEEEAIAYLESLYRHLIKVNKVHDARIIVGGKGRRNEENADKLAIVIMETSRRVKAVVPQLTFRYYKGCNDKVYTKALEVNGEGCTFPIIYSDDTNVPAVMVAYDVSEEEAEQYLPFGCGEYVLEGMSTGTPNTGINLLKALEVTLHNGFDRYYNMQIGEKTGDVSTFETFDELWEAYNKQLKPVVYNAANHNALNYIVANEEASYLHISMLMHDCIKRGKPMLGGGVRYLNASSEVFGIMSAADSFSAIKKLVFEDKLFTLEELVNMLDCNFEGYEKERQILLKAPKYGNDDEFADEMAQKVFNHIAKLTIEAGEQTELNKYSIVSVNNSMSAEWGTYCIASASGRKSGEPMNNGNGASINADKNGVTSLLNSMSKIDPTLHVGVIHNIRFTKEMFTGSFDKIKTVLTTFYENNGVQTNITVINKDDLENAMKNPEKYKNLVVRIGGFSAYFVELNPVVQREIILRTTYES